MVLRDLAGAGGELWHFFRVDPHLNGMAVDLQIFLRKAERQARCHANLLAHQIHPENTFGHRMLYLQAGVHFDEIKRAFLVEKFNGASTLISHFGNRIGTDRPDLGAFLFAYAGAWGLFKDLLVTALQRTIPFAQMNRIALTIAKYLHLNMARRGEVFLNINCVIAKGRFRLATRRAECVFQVLGALRHFHAATAAPCSGFDNDGVAHIGGDFLGRVQIGNAPLRAGDAWNTKRLCRFLSGDFIAHDADMLGGGANEFDPVILYDLHKVRVLGEKPIARMDRFGPRDLACRDDRGDRQIAVGAGGRADTDAFIGHAHMHRISIGGGMHGDCLNTHFARSADHAQRDFPAIGDENFFEHGGSHLIR